MSGDAKRDNSHKPDLSLLPFCFEKAVALVMQFGAKKYGRYNYLKGHTVTGLVASAKRHLGAINNGQDIDEESGMSHWALVAANALMAIHQQELGTLKDDRYQSRKDADSPKSTTVFQVVVRGSASKCRVVAGTYPDRKVAEIMAKDFFPAHWPPSSFAITVEEAQIET